MTLLDGKRLLITGVLTDASIAWWVAAAAQREGAEVILTSYGRARRLTERAARSLPRQPDVLELDVTSDADLTTVTHQLRDRWGTLDGVLHAIASAPPDAMGGGVVNTPLASLQTTFEVSVFSLQRLARTLGPLMAGKASGTSIVGLDFTAQPGWPRYDWMGIAKTTLRDLTRYLACELGGHGIRCNLVSSGPVRTPASEAIPLWEEAQASFPEHAPLGWDADDPSPVADAAVFLFSDLARSISGETIYVDGGIHATGGITLLGRTRGSVAFGAEQPVGVATESIS
jgi:enoyl ACP reductase